MAQSREAYEKATRRALKIGARCRGKHVHRSEPTGVIACGRSPLALAIGREIRDLVESGYTPEQAQEVIGIEASGRYQCLIVHVKRAKPLWNQAAHEAGANRAAFRFPGEPSDRDYARSMLQWVRTVPPTIDVRGKPGNCWVVNPDDATEEYLTYRDIPDSGIVEFRAPTQVIAHLTATHPEWMETYRAPISARVSVIAQGATQSSANVDKKLRFIKRERIDYAERVSFGIKSDNGGIPAYHGSAPAELPPVPANEDNQNNPNIVAIAASILPNEAHPETVQIDYFGTIRTVYSIIGEYLATRETHPGHATEIGQAIAMIAQGARVLRDEIDATESPIFTEEEIVNNQATIGEGLHFRRETIKNGGEPIGALNITGGEYPNYADTLRERLKEYAFPE